MGIVLSSLEILDAQGTLIDRYKVGLPVHDEVPVTAIVYVGRDTHRIDYADGKIVFVKAPGFLSKGIEIHVKKE